MTLDSIPSCRTRTAGPRTRSTAISRWLVPAVAILALLTSTGCVTGTFAVKYALLDTATFVARRMPLDDRPQPSAENRTPVRDDWHGTTELARAN